MGLRVRRLRGGAPTPSQRRTPAPPAAPPHAATAPAALAAALWLAECCRHATLCCAVRGSCAEWLVVVTAQWLA